MQSQQTNTPTINERELRVSDSSVTNIIQNQDEGGEENKQPEVDASQIQPILIPQEEVDNQGGITAGEDVKKLIPQEEVDNQGGITVEERAEQMQIDDKTLALKAIEAYLLGIETKNDAVNAPCRNLSSVLDNTIIRDKVMKVFEKLGQAKLKAIANNPTNKLHVSLLEKIGHYFNKLIRTITCGYIGYEFSTLEAKEAIRTDFDHNYNPDKEGFFVDSHTRFAQVVNKILEKNPTSNKEPETVLDQNGGDRKRTNLRQVFDQGDYSATKLVEEIKKDQENIIDNQDQQSFTDDQTANQSVAMEGRKRSKSQDGDDIESNYVSLYNKSKTNNFQSQTPFALQ